MPCALPSPILGLRCSCLRGCLRATGKKARRTAGAASAPIPGGFLDRMVLSAPPPRSRDEAAGYSGAPFLVRNSTSALEAAAAAVAATANAARDKADAEAASKAAPAPPKLWKAPIKKRLPIETTAAASARKKKRLTKLDSEPWMIKRRINELAERVVDKVTAVVEAEMCTDVLEVIMESMADADAETELHTDADANTDAGARSWAAATTGATNAQLEELATMFAAW